MVGVTWVPIGTSGARRVLISRGGIYTPQSDVAVLSCTSKKPVVCAPRHCAHPSSVIAEDGQRLHPLLSRSEWSFSYVYQSLSWISLGFLSSETYLLLLRCFSVSGFNPTRSIYSARLVSYCLYKFKSLF